MRTGWFQDSDGSYYYLNSASDGTRGKMLTGWHWIPDGSGLRKCYYFNPASDGTRGKMLSGTVVDGNLLNTDGAWVIDGVVQTR
jgi:glucan-binding YG repeat protein